MKKNPAFKIALAAILCAQALALSFLEGMLPPLPMLPPGAKPGFSNIITMFAAGSLGLPWALTVAAVKGAFAFITRGFTASLMSLSGGILSAAAMWLLLKISKEGLGLTGISMICAICHNLGQLAAAAIITGTAKTLYYLPALIVFGLLTGAVTGIIFKAVMPALEKQKKYLLDNIKLRRK